MSDRTALLFSAKPQSLDELAVLFIEGYRNDPHVYAAINHAKREGWTVEQTLLFLVEALLDDKRAALEAAARLTSGLSPLPFAFASNHP